ncbi:MULTISPECIES: ZIP family metal transporter [Croceitalea]|uniref:ZIP family metal transporter n=1 Tax=Croceitalea vernalis TaxID=3075599 RepID=A0ABU3BIS8_9FLAO|nr:MULTISPECIES: ZIP family metal transporter [unclassified Croceitalea]MDT0540229.1 ZIP family metal transporter [Croceitalea sp. P059]MDT0622064.1 ZIP family metal transporter [Croceitalea sp. P007]
MVYILPILAVIASFIFVYLIKPKSQKNIKLLLAFSGAFLLALTFFELLPEVYEKTDSRTVAVFILAGILLQVFLEFFSKGAEHGHMHIELKANSFPIVLFLSLSLHALIEGIPVTKDNNILYAILVHKIPVAIILSIFLLNSKLKIGYSIVFILLFAFMTPLGSFLSLKSNFIQEYGDQITSIAIGVFFHISTVVLFESSKGHSFNLRKLLVIILGVTVAYLL